MNKVRNFLLFLMIVGSVSIHAQLINDRLLLINDEGLCFFDTAEIHSIITIENPKVWNFHSVNCDDEIVSVTLIGPRLMDDNSFSSLLIKIRTNPFSLVSSEDCILSIADSERFAINDAREYSNGLFPVSDWYGNIYMLDTLVDVITRRKVMFGVSEIVPFVSSIEEGRFLYGYFQPEISIDGDKMLCVYEKSSRNRKRQIDKAQIIEINTKSKEIVPLPIFGISPRYSQNDDLILYLDIYAKPGTWKVYSKKEGKTTTLATAFDSVWLY